MKSFSHFVRLSVTVFCLVLAACSAPAAPSGDSGTPPGGSLPPTTLPTTTSGTEAPSLAPTTAATVAPATAAPTLPPTIAVTAVATLAPTTAAATAPPPTSTVPPTAAATETPPEPPTGDLVELLRTATVSQAEAASFRVTQDIEFASGNSNQTITEYVAPDRLHIVDSYGNDTIAIKGVGGWEKFPGKDWRPMELERSDGFFRLLSPENLALGIDMIDKSSARFVEIDTINGKSMYVLEYKIPAQTYTPPVTIKAWIGAQDKRVYRLESRKPVAPDKPDVDLQTNVYEYDIPITIEPPI